MVCLLVSGVSTGEWCIYWMGRGGVGWMGMGIGGGMGLGGPWCSGASRIPHSLSLNLGTTPHQTYVACTPHHRSLQFGGQSISTSSKAGLLLAVGRYFYDHVTTVRNELFPEGGTVGALPSAVPLFTPTHLRSYGLTA